MRRDRLQKLAQHLLLNVPAEKFDLATWFSECGTTACAVGHACSMPEFNAEGLVGFIPEWHQPRTVNYCPKFNSYTGYDAVCAFFDISRRDAYYMFSPSDYKGNFTSDLPTIRNVVSRIEEVADFDMFNGKICYAFDPETPET